MEKIEKRKSELENLMQEYSPAVRTAWAKIAQLEGDNSLRQNEKIAKIKDTIMQEVAKDDN